MMISILQYLDTPGRPSWIGLSPLRDPLRNPHAVWKGIMRIARPFVPSIPDIPDDFAKGPGRGVHRIPKRAGGTGQSWAVSPAGALR